MPQLVAVPLTPFALPLYAKSVNGIPMLVPTPPNALGLTLDAIMPSFDGPQIGPPPFVNPVNAYPRGGFDTSNYFTGQCPNCGRVHHIYTGGGYFCYALGPAFGVSIDAMVVFQDYTSDAWAATLVANGFLIES